MWGRNPSFYLFLGKGGIYLSTKERDIRRALIALHNSSFDTIKFVRETCETLYNPIHSLHSFIVLVCQRERVSIETSERFYMNEFLKKRENNERSIYTTE